MQIYFLSLLIFSFSIPSFGLDLSLALKEFKKSDRSKANTLKSSIAESQLDQSKSKLLPSISLLANSSVNTYKDDSKTSDINSRAQLNHSLFAGGQEWQALKYYKNQKEAASQFQAYSQMDLDANFVVTFFKVVNLRKQKELAKEQLDTSLEREKLLLRRQKIGQSKKSDLLNARAQRLSSEINFTEVLSELKLAEEALSIQLQRDIANEPLSFKKQTLPSLNAEVAKNHPLKLADEYEQKSFNNIISGERAAHLPSISVQANYYFKNDISSSSNQKKWDASLQFELPLFSGGLVNRRVEENQLKKEESRLLRKAEIDELQLSLKQLSTNYQEEEKNISAKEQALKLYKESYLETKKEYDLGLVSNIEVLSAFNIYIQEKKSLEQSKFEQASRAYQILIYRGDAL